MQELSDSLSHNTNANCVELVFVSWKNTVIVMSKLLEFMYINWVIAQLVAVVPSYKVQQNFSRPKVSLKYFS